MDDSRAYRVSSCCSAKTGANLIGMLYGVVAFYLLIISAEYAEEVFNLTGHDSAQRFLSMLGLSSIAKYNVVGIKSLRITTIIASLITGVSYITSALLVIGINNGNGRLLLPWIVYSILLLVVYVISMLFTVAVIIVIHGVLGFAVFLPPALIVVLMWAFFIVVVNKHYTELTEVQPPGDVISTPRQDEACTSGVSYLHTLNGTNNPRPDEQPHIRSH